MEQIIDVTLAGLTFPCALRWRETAVFPHPDPAAPRVGIDPVRLRPEDWDYFRSTGMTETPQTEYSLLTASFSDALMDFDRMILHGVALRWRDKAWLICGSSGVGKSTQTRFLQELRPGEFSVICGDRPALEFRHTENLGTSIACPPAPVPHPEGAGSLVPPQETAPIGEAHRGESPAHPLERSSVPSTEAEKSASILVHPSPWNGKENWFGAEAAPLAGLILLQRGEENRIATLPPREAAIRTYAQVIQTCTDPEKIKKAASLTTTLLNSVPIWQLTSFQVPDSTKLLLETVFSP